MTRVVSSGCDASGPAITTPQPSRRGRSCVGYDLANDYYTDQRPIHALRHEEDGQRLDGLDTETNAPAATGGRWQTGLTAEHASDLAMLLNRPYSAIMEAADPFPPPEEDLGGGDICSLQTEPSTEDDKPLD